MVVWHLHHNLLAYSNDVATMLGCIVTKHFQMECSSSEQTFEEEKTD